MKHFIMLTKNEIKYIQSLYHKKQRNEESLFVAEGPRLAEELLNSHFIIRQIYATQLWLHDRPNLKVPLKEISVVELSRISNLQTPNEVLVIAVQSFPLAEPVCRGTLTIALDGIRDPGNMGTIIRIADWFGIQQIVCSKDCVEMYNPKVVQSTMGSITRVQCWYKNFHDWKFEDDLPVFGALLTGQNIYTVREIKEGLLVIGSEAEGIREPLLSKITKPVTVPKAGGAESLNAAVATGIIAGWLVNNRSHYNSEQ